MKTNLLVPFKWAGSKVKERLKLQSMIGQEKIKIVEPFMGTGIVSGTFGYDCIGNDLNQDIINLYSHCKNEAFNSAAKDMMTHEKVNNKEYFYEVREKFNETPLMTLERAILFFYIQNCAHFGLYRLNNHGKYTSTYHFLTKSPKYEGRLHSLHTIHDSFRGISCSDYSVFLDYVKRMIERGEYKPDLFFFDPPYINSAYDDYSVDDGFNLENLKEITDYASFMYKTHGICSIICNYPSKYDEELYKDATEIMSFKSQRAMRLQDSEAKLTKESIYVLYGKIGTTETNNFL